MTWFILAFSSALLSAVAAVSQKKVLFRMDALGFSVLLALVTLLFTLPLFAAVDFAALEFLPLAVLFGKSLLGALAFLCVMQAIKNLELSGALPMMVLTPGLVALTAFVFIGDVLSLQETGGLLLLLAGTYVLEMRPGVSLLQPFTVFARSRRHHYIVAALLLFTVTSVLDRYLLTDLRIEPLPMLAFQNLFHAFFFLLFALVAGRRIAPMIREARPAAGWFVFIAVCTLGYRFAHIEAVSMAPVALVLAVKRLSVFIAAMLGGRLFREQHLPRKAVAIIVLIVGATLVVGL